MKITYLSHGQNETGGYFHETTLCNALGEVREKRFRRNFKGLTSWIQLFSIAFFSAHGEVIVTVARLAWPVYLRNYFNKKKILLVLHNYDPADGKPRFYYRLLDAFLKRAAASDRMGIVVVADYWKHFFEQKFGFKKNIYLFPNLFNNATYATYRNAEKAHLVHLGQFSDKIDKEQYRLLISNLRDRGFDVYFSSNLQVVHSDFPIVYFSDNESYLEKMSRSKATVIFNKISEGWNRVAHESFLVGTPVVGYGEGGFRELMQAFGGTLESDPEIVAQCIEENKLNRIEMDHLDHFDVKMTRNYAEPIQKWLNS